MSAPRPVIATPLRNSYWVLPGKVLAGEHPAGSTPEVTRERLKRLIDAGIECFIDLTEPSEIKAYDAELPFSIEYLRKPIKDHGIPAQRGHMAEILDCLHDTLLSGRSVYVHCRAGIGRTGTVIGCFLIERGLAGEAALDELNRLWQQCERAQSWGSVPETDQQVEFVRRWKARAVFDDRGRLTQPTLAVEEDDAPSQPETPPWAHLLIDAPGPTVPTRSDTPRAAAKRSPASTRSQPATESRSPTPAVPQSPDPSRPKRGASPPPNPTPLSRASAGATPDLTATPTGGGLAGAVPNAAAASGGSSGAAPSDPTTPASRDIPGARPDLSAPRDSIGAAGSLTAASRSPAAAAPDWPVASRAETGAPPDPTGATNNSAGAQPTAPSRHSGAATGNLTAAPAGGVAGAGLDPTAGSHGPAAAASARTAVPHGLAAATPDLTAGPHGSTGATPGRTTASRGPAGATPDATAASHGPATATPGRTDGAAGAPLGAGDLLSDPTSVANAPGTQPNHPASSTPSTPSRGGFPSLDDEENLDPLLNPEALAAASTLRTRFLGALLGLAVGDAVAAATQYRRPGSFTPLGDLLGGGPFDLPRGGWSDDTAMALCLADSLLERDRFDARDQVERYRRWQQEGYLSATGQCLGITASSARAIAMAHWRRQAFSGSHDPSQLDPEPLSRVAPAVLFFFGNSGQAIEHATEAARTTCQAPAVLEACRSLARGLHAALSGQPKAVVLGEAALAAPTSLSPGVAAGTPAAPTAGRAGGDTAAARSATAKGISSATPGHPGAVPARPGVVTASQASRPPTSRVPGANSNGRGTHAPSGPGMEPHGGTSAPAALAAAVAAFGATDNFRDAILYAANLGGDSDVVAAVCGQLAGAYYGVKAIPTSWLNSLMRKELITSYADRLLARAMEGMAG